jgi:protein SCO1/2
VTLGVLALALLAAAGAEQRYPVTAVVLSVDLAHRTFVASSSAIPDYMEAMVMPFSVRDAALLEGLVPSAIVDFTLVVTADDSWVEELRPRRYQNFEREPMLADRLALLDTIASQATPLPKPALGDAVPDFHLVDQSNAPVRLSQFAGKVVALNFIYTTCPLPNYCLRLSNHFGVLRTRFEKQMGRDVALLSVTFDPAHDSPEVLAKYAARWAGDKTGWHFLTGPPPDVKRVARSLGLNFWPDEGTVTHALHVFVIGRDGRLKADMEGNEYTSQQLGDVIAAQLSR